MAPLLSSCRNKIGSRQAMFATDCEPLPGAPPCPIQNLPPLKKTAGDRPAVVTGSQISRLGEAHPSDLSVWMPYFEPLAEP
jgi:hypothetical protein